MTDLDHEFESVGRFIDAIEEEGGVIFDIDEESSDWFQITFWDPDEEEELLLEFDEGDFDVFSVEAEWNDDVGWH